MSTSSRLRVDPVEHLRAHAYVAEQLRRQITLRLVAPGHALPPDRELARLFGVGRATVQQAIGLLEGEGLVERRRGRSGGTFVVAPVGDDASLARVLAAIRRSRATVEAALAFRAGVEPAAAAAAAEARTKADLRDLASAVARAQAATTDAEFMEHDTELHLALGRATHNPFFLDAIERVRLALNDALVALPDSALWRVRSNEEHDVLLAAIEAGDANSARAAMHAHVRTTDQSVRALLAAL
ncbi:MAG: FCD domain-containing protein [Actinobacteria bacterium]|nr:FCD domain-containing protein [Actinomycetota bacterium]